MVPELTGGLLDASQLASDFSERVPKLFHQEGFA
jgi:hypothetical protein